MLAGSFFTAQWNSYDPSSSRTFNLKKLSLQAILYAFKPERFAELACRLVSHLSKEWLYGWAGLFTYPANEIRRTREVLCLHAGLSIFHSSFERCFTCTRLFAFAPTQSAIETKPTYEGLCWHVGLRSTFSSIGALIRIHESHIKGEQKSLKRKLIRTAKLSAFPLSLANALRPSMNTRASSVPQQGLTSLSVFSPVVSAGFPNRSRQRKTV